MERRAAVNLLLEEAEKSSKLGQIKYSNIVSDLARRVALSIDDNDVNLEKYCSRMAAELMFRDDYQNANKVLKLAEVPPADNILRVDPIDKFIEQLKDAGAVVVEKPVEPLEKEEPKEEPKEPQTKLPEDQQEAPEVDTTQQTPEQQKPSEQPPVTSLDDLKRSLLRMGVRPDQLI